MTDTVPTARLTRSFALPVSRLFDAWTDPALLGQWMFGPNVRDEEIVRLATDPRIGGAFSFVVRRQVGELDHVGVYRELSRPRRLVFTWAVVHGGKSDGDSVVALDFAARGAGSELRLAHELPPAWANFVAQSAEAWGRMLDALATNVR